MRNSKLATIGIGAGLFAAAACTNGNDTLTTSVPLTTGATGSESSAEMQPSYADAGASSRSAASTSSSGTSQPASSGAGSSLSSASSSSVAAASSAAGGSTSGGGSSAAAEPTAGASQAMTGTAGSSSAASTASSPPPAAGSPTIGGCAIFPPDNPWNTRVDDPVKFPVHANSATYIANMSPGTHLHADWGDWSTNHYGIPWQTVPGTQPAVPMTFDYADESDPGPYPLPPNALVEGGAGSGGDMHVLVVDTGTCTLYETWSSTYVGPGWQCGSGAKFPLGTNALRPDGWTSSDAAGLPVLPGLVRLDEVKAGAIHHALRFTVASSQQGYIHPATHAAGSGSSSLPPMGLRVRLKASFDLSAFSGPTLVILTAMKQYGMLLADNGSDWFVSGDSDDGWPAIQDAIDSAFGQVHGSDFEAVETGPILH